MAKNANVRVTTELKNPTDSGTHHRLLCMTGPNKGKVYYLTGKRIVIGRGENTDIQIADTKISREHAELSFADNGYTLTDLGSPNGIIVNDTKIKQKKLLDAEKIVIGSTVLKYSLIEVTNSELVIKEDEKSPAIPKSNKSKSRSNANSGGVSESVGSSSSRSEKKGAPKGLILGAVVLIVIFVLFDKGDAPQTGNRNSAENRDFNNEFAESAPKKALKEDAEVKKKFNNLLHSGRREFSEGNYFRAMEDFRLALLLMPNDGHASFLLSKAKQRLDDDIEKNFIKGKQEYEAKKMQAAIVSYCSVVQLIQNYPNDERYRNAMLKIGAIESELGMEKGEIKCFEEKSTEQKN